MASQDVTLPGGTVIPARLIYPHGLPVSPFGGVHTYMLVLGSVLLALTALFGAALAQVWMSLGHRIDTARSAFRRLLRTGDPSVSPLVRSGTPLSFPSRVSALWLPTATAHVLLYAVQENIESAAQGAPAPGLSVLAGVHWAASLIQLGIACPSRWPRAYRPCPSTEGFSRISRREGVGGQGSMADPLHLTDSAVVESEASADTCRSPGNPTLATPASAWRRLTTETSRSRGGGSRKAGFLSVRPMFAHHAIRRLAQS